MFTLYIEYLETDPLIEVKNGYSPLRQYIHIHIALASQSCSRTGRHIIKTCGRKRRVTCQVNNCIAAKTGNS